MFHHSKPLMDSGMTESDSKFKLALISLFRAQLAFPLKIKTKRDHDILHYV